MPIYRGKYAQNIYYGNKKVLAVFAGNQQVYSGDEIDPQLIMGTYNSCIIPSGVKKIRYGVFMPHDLSTSIVLPSSIKNLGSAPAGFALNSAFTDVYCCFSQGAVPFAPWGASNATIHYDYSPEPQSPGYITQTMQFLQGTIQRATIPYGVTKIKDYAFYGCHDLISVELPSSVTSIGLSAFVFCERLSHITIPSSVTTIGTAAFYDCRRLSSITLPANVTSIGSWAFESCYALTDIYCGFAEGTVSGAPWGAISSVTTIHYNSTGPGE